MSQDPSLKLSPNDQQLKELLAHAKTHTDTDIKLLSAVVEMQAKLNTILDTLQSIVVGFGNDPDRVSPQIEKSFDTHYQVYLKDALEPVEYPDDETATSEKDQPSESS